jgi:lysophospholipase L1-like esterase
MTGVVAVVTAVMALGPFIATTPAEAMQIPDPGYGQGVFPRPVRPDSVDTQWPKHPPWDACPRPVWPSTPFTGTPGDGRRVLFIGDSLTRESRKRSTTLLSRHGWTPTYRCWGSKRLDWGLDQVARARELKQLPEFVVMALGTNDISWETPQTTERRVRQLLERLGPDRQVLWVDLHLTRSAWLDARAAWFNDLLHRLAKEHSNLTVVRWHEVAREHGIRGYDGIHYGPHGYRLRAQTVAEWLDRVGSRT